MKKVKLGDMAEIFSGLSYRRYLDDNGDMFKVVVQRSIKKDGILSDFEELSLKSNIKERFFTRQNDVLMKMPYPYDVVCVKEEGLVVSDRIAIIRLRKGHDPNFITHLLTRGLCSEGAISINSTEDKTGTLSCLGILIYLLIPLILD